MRNSRITIKQLAERLNLSPSTVSRALHNHPSIGKKTCDEVQKLANSLGYFPNSLASNLRRNKTNLIGVLIPRIDRTFQSLAISGIEEIAHKAGYYVTIFQSNNSYEREVENARMLLSNRADGVIGCLALETNQYDHFTNFITNGIPLVFFDRVCNEIESSKVIIDDFTASQKATEHLISIGCTRIAHIAGRQDITIFRSRLEGYKAALLKNNMEIDKSLICITSDLSSEEGSECMERLLDLPVPPDGLFCANDNTAISAIQFAKKKGIRIPDELAIVGFSNTPASTIIEPSLTTIDDHAFEMGQAAARLLIRQIEDKDLSIASETITIRHDLIIRESTDRSTKETTK
ncbi:MAG: LacI family DNA-binding transcriptional regulator [Bacteroidota bacterium]|nr:LacI family DNA-binding transcriptional regulator [Bacteroidota bacterium]